MAPDSRSHETTFNKALGAALRAGNPDWRAPGAVQVEALQSLQSAKGKRPDLLIMDPALPPLTIEPDYDPHGAEQDAISRLGETPRNSQLPVRTSLALHIPVQFRALEDAAATQALIEGAQFNYAIYKGGQHNYTRFPARGFITNHAQHLCALLPKISIDQQAVETLTQDAVQTIAACADMLDAKLRPDQRRQISGSIGLGSPLNIYRTALVIWLNALRTQHAIHESGTLKVPGMPLNGEVRYPGQTHRAWMDILSQNWKAIFEPAVNLLRTLHGFAPAHIKVCLDSLYKTTGKILAARIGTVLNISAEIYPQLAQDRKTAAAFYTRASIAELLAALAIPARDRNDWGRADLFESISIADLAIGTGTLVRAGYARIREHHMACGGTIESRRQLHSDAMRSGVKGLDVSPIASHMASTSIAGMEPGTPYRRDQIGWASVKGGRTGSLELLGESEIEDQLALQYGPRHQTKSATQAATAEGESEDGARVTVRDRGLDYILMNPPYSRTRRNQKLFDIAGLNEKQKNACQARLKELIQGGAANLQAGLASCFCMLAEQKLKRGGRLGIVLPLTAAFAESWRATRAALERDFNQMIAITIAGGGADASLSADTGMNEMLLIARRRENGEKATPLRCITLNNPPGATGIAAEIADAMEALIANSAGERHSTLRVGKAEIGQMVNFAPSGGKPWTPVGCTQPRLALACTELAEQGLLVPARENKRNPRIQFPVPMVLLKDICAPVGPTHHLIGTPADTADYGKPCTGAFIMYPIQYPQAYLHPDISMWATESENQRRLVVLPTHYGQPNPAPTTKKTDYDLHEVQTTLFHARSANYSSQSLLAASTEKMAHGGRAWAGIQLRGANKRKALALWFNSGYGILSYYYMAQRTQHGRGSGQIAALRNILRVPDITALSTSALRKAAAVFNRLQNRELLRLNQAAQDPLRKEINQAVTIMLGLPEKALAILDELIAMWCAEPHVQGKYRGKS